MIAKFQARELMVHVAPEDDKHCHGGSYHPITPQSTCGKPSCTTDDCREHHTFKPDPPTQCDFPTCLEPPKRRDARVDDLTRSNLALLQKELRQALDLGR